MAVSWEPLVGACQDLNLGSHPERESPGCYAATGFEDDAVAEGLELGDGPPTLALGIAPTK
jgi:hypothetical protein